MSLTELGYALPSTARPCAARLPAHWSLSASSGGTGTALVACPECSTL